MRYDIVYILKKDVQADELRYSLRSVEQNFPFGKIWFFCGKPAGIEPDGYVPFEQTGRTKWQKATSTFRAICECKEVSENFWLFNDDFFVLRKTDAPPYMMRGTLAERVKDLRSRHAVSGYASRLDEARAELEAKGYTSYDYALHVPMLINKAKALEVLNEFRSPMFRSLYGNYCNVGGEIAADVKIYELEGIPGQDWTFLSTCEASFESGEVGSYIKERFQEPSRWEDTHDQSLQNAERTQVSV